MRSFAATVGGARHVRAWPGARTAPHVPIAFTADNQEGCVFPAIGFASILSDNEVMSECLDVDILGSFERNIEGSHARLWLGYSHDTVPSPFSLDQVGGRAVFSKSDATVGGAGPHGFDHIHHLVRWIRASCVAVPRMGGFLMVNHAVESTSAPAEPDPVSKFADCLNAYRSLKADWAYDGAEAPSDTAVDTVLRFAELAEDAGVIPTRCYVAGDGEVGLAWEHGHGYATLASWGDGNIVFYARPPDDGDEVSGDVPAPDDIPASLLKVLRTFA